MSSTESSSFHTLSFLEAAPPNECKNKFLESLSKPDGEAIERIMSAVDAFADHVAENNMVGITPTGYKSGIYEHIGLYLIGSHARGEARPDSDIDLVIARTYPDAEDEEYIFPNEYPNVQKMRFDALNGDPFALTLYEALCTSSDPDVDPTHTLTVVKKPPSRYDSYAEARGMMRFEPKMQEDGSAIDIVLHNMLGPHGRKLPNLDEFEQNDKDPQTLIPLRLRGGLGTIREVKDIDG